MEDEGAVTARVGVLGGDGAWSVAEVLRGAGVAVADLEPAPKQVAEAVARKWHYGLASVRAGLLGHPRAILQLLQQVNGARPKGWIWKGEGAVDGFRPEIDPEGLPREGIEGYRLAHLAAVARLVQEVDRLILPLCTARAWVDGAGTVFGARPKGVTLPSGVKISEIVFSADDLRSDLHAMVEVFRALNPRLVLQVSVLPSLGEVVDWPEVEGLQHDPIFDALLEARRKGGKGAGLLAFLAQGGDIVRFAPVVAAPVAEDVDAERRRRRKEKRKAKGDNPGKVICEDELLEAFAK